MADDSEQSRPPRLMLIAGATGVGKSTLGNQILGEFEFSRHVGTDTVREILRSFEGPDENPVLHRSSFSHGKSKDPINDWLDTCEVLDSGIRSVISRSRREGVDLLLEGVHIVPSRGLLEEWRESGGVAVGLVLHVDHEETHQNRIKAREKNTFRGADRYLAAFDRIREIQRGIKERGNISDWKAIDTHLIQEPLLLVRQWLDQAWYQQR
uniref:2-phosphoglycerate kinase n=1 Tax=uncultured marine group II/III euryarchaeote KM3_109_G01 TaxID=1457850 RepID=A0A075G6Y1_9EURY|nr:hypothetical protein [uncultured marine group II/III euryarchaeote KM3_109_G01]